MTASSLTCQQRSTSATFDQLRRRFLSGVQNPQLRRSAIVLLSAGAGMVPMLAAPALAIPHKVPTDGADTLLMLIGSALVLLMTPGLAFFYGGFTRAKNVLNTMMMSFFLMGLIGVLWVVIGYSLAFGTSFNSPFVGGLEYFMLNGVGGKLGDEPIADGLAISATSFALFQGMFAIIAPALISGALCERLNFKAWFWFSILRFLFVYCPMAHMVWGGGLLGAAPGMMGAIDFAGGTVIHIESGACALLAAHIVGPRTDFPQNKRPPHNVPFILLGAGLLWFGWYGFNGASAYSAKAAGFSFLATSVAASAALLCWCMLEWFLDGKPTAVGAATGSVAGLVGITPAAGFVYPGPAIIIGALASAACFSAVRLKPLTRIDDSLDCFFVHGVGGTVGCILTGIFAVPALVPADFFPMSAQILEKGGNFALTLVQFKAVLFTFGYSAICTALILWIVNSLVGLRVTPEEEERGLDYVLHGEEAYDPMSS